MKFNWTIVSMPFLYLQLCRDAEFKQKKKNMQHLNINFFTNDSNFSERHYFYSKMTRFQESKGQSAITWWKDTTETKWLNEKCLYWVFLETDQMFCQFQTEDEHIHPGSSKTVFTKPSDEVPNTDIKCLIPQNKPRIFSTYWQYMVDTKHGLCYCVENVFY